MIGAYAISTDINKPIAIEFVKAAGVNDKVGNHISADLVVPGTTDDLCVTTWLAMKNTGQYPPWNLVLSSIDATPNVLSYKHTADDMSASWTRGWNNNKIRIRVVRADNRLSAWTSNFVEKAVDDPELQTSNLLSIEFADDDEFLSCFNAENGGGSIGFCVQSQQMTSFKIREFTVPKVIYRTDTDARLTYDINNVEQRVEFGKWNDEIGIGRFVQNPVTNKTFWIGDNNYVKVAEFNSNEG